MDDDRSLHLAKIRAIEGSRTRRDLRGSSPRCFTQARNELDAVHQEITSHRDTEVVSRSAKPVSSNNFRVAPPAQALSGPFSSVGHRSTRQSSASSCLEAACVADAPKADRDRAAGTHGRNRGLYAICLVAPTTASPILDRLGCPRALSRTSPRKLKHRRGVVALLHHRMGLAEEASAHQRPSL
jgi:hypothetical protein